MNDRGDVVFHLPGEGMAGEVLGVTRVLPCFSCKPSFSSRTEAFHREGGEVLERRVFVVYKLQGETHTASPSWLQPCASFHPISAAHLQMPHRQDKNAALGWGMSPQQGWGPSPQLSILQGTSEELREFCRLTHRDCCCREADLSPGKRKMLKAAPSTLRFAADTQPAKEATPQQLFGSQQH